MDEFCWGMEHGSPHVYKHGSLKDELETEGQ